ncbi:MAG: hypothetical protein FWE85_01215 [Clostridiales bacterium]|nr:hypothetical protein [Clostridiales bacterium]
MGTPLILLAVGGGVMLVVILSALAVGYLEKEREPRPEVPDDVLQDLLKSAKTEEERAHILRMAQEQGVAGAGELTLAFAGPEPGQEPAPPPENSENIEETCEPEKPGEPKDIEEPQEANEQKGIDEAHEPEEAYMQVETYKREKPKQPEQTKQTIRGTWNSFCSRLSKTAALWRKKAAFWQNKGKG